MEPAGPRAAHGAPPRRRVAVAQPLQVADARPASVDETLAATEVWTNPIAVVFNTPVLKDGFLYGFSDKGNLFCLNAKDGKPAWTDTTKRGAGRA